MAAGSLTAKPRNEAGMVIVTVNYTAHATPADPDTLDFEAIVTGHLAMAELVASTCKAATDFGIKTRDGNTVLSGITAAAKLGRPWWGSWRMPVPMSGLPKLLVSGNDVGGGTATVRFYFNKP